MFLWIVIVIIRGLNYKKTWLEFSNLKTTCRDVATGYKYCILYLLTQHVLSVFLQVGKAGGDKWKSMTDAVKNCCSVCLFMFCTAYQFSEYLCVCLSMQEKAPYIAKATKRKVEYEKAMKAYNTKQVKWSASSTYTDVLFCTTA